MSGSSAKRSATGQPGTPRLAKKGKDSADSVGDVSQKILAQLGRCKPLRAGVDEPLPNVPAMTEIEGLVKASDIDINTLDPHPLTFTVKNNDAHTWSSLLRLGADPAKVGRKALLMLALEHGAFMMPCCIITGAEYEHPQGKYNYALSDPDGLLEVFYQTAALGDQHFFTALAPYLYKAMLTSSVSEACRSSLGLESPTLFAVLLSQKLPSGQESHESKILAGRTLILAMLLKTAMKDELYRAVGSEEHNRMKLEEVEKMDVFRGAASAKTVFAKQFFSASPAPDDGAGPAPAN